MVEPPGGGLFRILGPVELRSGEKWTSVKAGKQRALLAMLLLHPGQPVSQDRLIEALWDSQPPKGAVNLLSVYVHQLRRQMGEDGVRVLVTRPPGYQAVLEPGELDADLFAELLSEGRQALANNEPERAADLLAGALECWQGDEPLADVEANPMFSTGRARLAESRNEAIGLRAEAELACGRPAEVVAEMRDLLRGNPLQEKWWALLMRALRQDGRQAEALEAYDRARKRIGQELGVAPGPELQQLFQRILEADADSPAGDDRGAGLVPRPQQLPADIADFTGRADQVEQVCALMAEDGPGTSPGAVRVVVVMGAGGLGKTTLAVHAAHLLKDQFPDGQLYANLLGATHPAAPADILARFLRDLGMDGARVPLDAEERATHFRTRLAGRRMLIVLDDARDAAQVLPLLPGSASAAVLVTSRNRLPELMGSQVIDLEVLRPDEARALFTGMVGDRRVAAEPEAASDVLAACAGLPLAIRIVGARLAARANWTVRTLADRLADEQRRLDEMRVGNLAVRASFEVSFASLAGPAEPGGVDPARAFCLLGVWTGPSFSLPAASAVLGVPPGAVADALYALVDAHLLESPEPDEFRFHDLLRVFAADRARVQESEQARHDAIVRVLTWYLHTAEAVAGIISPHHARVPLDPAPPTVQPLGFKSLEAAVKWGESEQQGVLAAIRLAADTGLNEIAWKLAAAEMSFFYRRSHWAEWVETHNIGLASARALGDRQAEAWMLNNLGMAYGLQGTEESIDCFEQALAISRELSDVWAEGRAVANLANTHYRLHRFAEARSAAERSLVIQRLAGSRYGEGIALGILGSTCEKLGDFSEAIDFLNQALAIFRELGEPDAEAETLTDLGDAFLGLGQIGEAVGRLEEALAIRWRIEDQHGQAETLHKLGQAQLRAGQPGKARDLLAEALVLLQEVRDHAQIAEVQARLSQIRPEHD